MLKGGGRFFYGAGTGSYLELQDCVLKNGNATGPVSGDVVIQSAIEHSL